MMKWFTLATVTLISTIQLGVAAPPKWYTQQKHNMYQPEFYLIGVGEGDTQEKAMYNAQLALSSQIEVKLSAEITSMMSSYRTSEVEEISSRYESLGKTIVQAHLYGAEVAEKEQVGGKHYIMLALDKDQYSRTLLEELNQKRIQLVKTNSEIDDLLASGKIYSGLNTLLETDDMVSEFKTMAIIYTSLSGESYPDQDILSTADLHSQIRTILSRLNLEILSGNDQSAVRGKLFSEPVAAKVTYVPRNGESVPVANFKLKMYNTDGTENSVGSTDSKGIVEFYPYALGDRRDRMIIRPVLKRLPRIYSDELRSLETAFKFTIRQMPPVTFEVMVTDEFDNPMFAVQDAVKESVIDAGHHTGSEDAPFLLTGQVILLETDQIDGFAGTQYLAKSELTLFMRIKETNEDIGSITLTGKGLDDKSRDIAVNKSYKKLTISESKLARLLSDAEPKLRKIREQISASALKQAELYFRSGNYPEALEELAKVTEGEMIVAESYKLSEKIKSKLSDQLSESSSSEDSKYLQLVSGNYKNPDSNKILTLSIDGTWQFGDADEGTWYAEGAEKIYLAYSDGSSTPAYLVESGSKLVFDGIVYWKQY
ncbi:LPP20 family lipoprotein [bacterium]|nr:LPP20 family lipoprotein [bacterium]